MKLYYGTYGHHLSGKLYVYWGDDNYRTGQQVVAPVTNKWSGKNYNTMFTIARTQSEKNAQDEVNRLNESGIIIKWLNGNDVLSLPGGKDFDSKAEWKRESEQRYCKIHNLPPLSEPIKKPKGRPPKNNAAPKASSNAGQTKRSASIIRLKSTLIKDTATQKAKSALLARKNTANNSTKAKERLKQMKGREAFIE